MKMDREDYCRVLAAREVRKDSRATHHYSLTAIPVPSGFGLERVPGETVQISRSRKLATLRMAGESQVFQATSENTKATNGG